MNVVGGYAAINGLGGTAVSGEATYSPDMPFGVSDLELNASQFDGLGGGAFVVIAGCVYVPEAGDWPLDLAGPESAIKNPVAAATLGGTTDPQYATGFSAGYLKGMKQVSLGLSADYQSRIRATVSWSSSFGAGYNNPMYDRDFASASIRYSF